MKLLFVAGPTPSNIFALAPLATAARDAGHRVLMSAPREMASVVTDIGIPAVAATSRALSEIKSHRRSGEREVVPEDVDHPEFVQYTGRWFGRLAAASLPRLREVASAWRPDVVIGGPHAYAAALLAHELSVPYVRHTWAALDTVGVHTGTEGELVPELEQAGLSRLPTYDLFVDNCPPGIRPWDATPAQQIRYVPINAQRQVEPWMYTRGERRRVCVTGGSMATRGNNFDLIRTMVEHLTEQEAEIVVPAPREVADELNAEFDGVRAGWFPLDVVMHTCDLVVHHAGGLTGQTAMTAGVPQLVIPQEQKCHRASRLLSDYGAAVSLLPGEVTDDNVSEALRALLNEPSYGERSRALAAEIAAMPSPDEVVTVLADLSSR